VAATLAKADAEAVGVGVGVVDTVNAVDAVDTVNTVKTVDPETATKLCTHIATLTAILQMHAESINTGSREETMEKMSTFASSAGCQVMSKLIASSTNV